MIMTFEDLKRKFHDPERLRAALKKIFELRAREGWGPRGSGRTLEETIRLAELAKEVVKVLEEKRVLEISKDKMRFRVF